MRHKNYASNFDYLVPPRADTHIANRSAREILQAIDIRPGCRRQIRKPPDLGQPFLPTRYHLVDRLDSGDRLPIGRHAIDLPPVHPKTPPHRDLGKTGPEVPPPHPAFREPV